MKLRPRWIVEAVYEGRAHEVSKHFTKSAARREKAHQDEMTIRSLAYGAVPHFVRFEIRKAVR